jgi:hypothetical protein
MMRRSLTTLMLVVTLGLSLLGAALAIAIKVRGHDGTTAGVAASGTRSWPVTMSAAPEDFALAELSFDRAPRAQLAASGSPRMTVSGPFGDDYLIAATLRLAKPGVPRVLVLLVNRPSPLLDPVSVHVRLAVSRSLGEPLLRAFADPLARGTGARAPLLCNLALHGSALKASAVHPLRSRGQRLAGFDAAEAVAQAYDVVCDLPHASSFEQVVERAGSVAPGSTETPSPTQPPTSPAPPVGKLPGEGCVPAPGFACPGAASAATSSSPPRIGDPRLK